MPIGEHRVSVVGQGLERSAAGPAVLGGLLAPRRRRACTPASASRSRDPDPAPPGVADQVAADLVGDTVEGDPGLGDLSVEQVLIGQRDLLVDHPVDPQLPVLGVDGGRHDGRTDLVEINVRRPPREPGRPRQRRGGRRGTLGDRQLQQAPDRLDLPPSATEEIAEAREHACADDDDAGPDEEGTPGSVLARCRKGWTSQGRSASQTRYRPRRPEPCRSFRRAGESVRRRRRSQPGPGRRSAIEPSSGRRPGRRTRSKRQPAEDTGHQQRLVVLPDSE